MAKHNDTPAPTPFEGLSGLDTGLDMPIETITEPVMVNPADLIGKVTTGDVAAFQSARKVRKTWAWDTFAVGNVLTVSEADYKETYGAALGYAKGTKGTKTKPPRAKQEYGSRIIEVMTADGPVKLREIMRLA